MEDQGQIEPVFQVGGGGSCLKSAKNSFLKGAIKCLCGALEITVKGGNISFRHLFLVAISAPLNPLVAVSAQNLSVSAQKVPVSVQNN